MTNPRKHTTVVIEAVGDGVGVFDPEQGKSYVLNATSALVFEHCDGETTPRQMTELLRLQFNVTETQAEKLLRLTLDELQTAGLLEADAAFLPPSPHTYSRREAFTSLAALGLSVALLPMIARVAEGQGGHTLIPLLECVDDNGDGTFTAHFGYLNQSDATITLPVGPQNMFVPGQMDLGQPTVFLPGEHLSVFSVVFSAGDSLKWMLKADGDKRHEVEASAASEICTTTTTTTTTQPPTSPMTAPIHW